MIGLIAMAISAVRVFVVSPSGQPGAAATLDAPASLEWAANQLQAADRLVLKGGKYYLNEPLILKVRAESGWTVIEAAPGEQPVIDGSRARPKDGGSASHLGLVTLEGAARVRILGLAVQNSFFGGFKVHDSSMIDLVNCKSDRSFSPGIGVWNSTDLRVVGCEVTRANTQAMRLFGSKDRECPHEAISIAGVDRFEVAWNEVHHTEKEGIDVKEVSRNGVVHHNWVHHAERQGLYADAWFGRLHHVEFVSNVSHDNEWGAVISCEGKNSTLDHVRIAHNLIYRNRASGIFFGTWGLDGPRTHVTLDRNTLAANGSMEHWAGPTGNIDVRSKAPRELRIVGNLLVDGKAFDLATFVDPDRGKQAFEEVSMTVESNVFASRRDTPPSVGQYGTVHAWYGRSARFAGNPFVNAGASDFRIAPDTDFLAGAFDPGAERLPAVASPLQGFEPYLPRVRRGWPAAIRPDERRQTRN